MLVSAHALPATRRGVYWGWERVLTTERGKGIGLGEDFGRIFYLKKKKLQAAPLACLQFMQLGGFYG